jgi:hypothetical protein
VQHLTVRVAWHDRAWDGTVCDHPSENGFCLALKRVREDRNDADEERVAGRHWADLSATEYPPCQQEARRGQEEIAEGLPDRLPEDREPPFNTPWVFGRQRKSWEWKLEWYATNGFVVGENLFTTEDDSSGGLDQAQLTRTAQEIDALL